VTPRRCRRLARRDFLKGAVVGGAAAAATAGNLPEPAQAQRVSSPAAAGYEFLHDQEAAFVEALVDHMILADEHTPRGTDLGLNIFIDRALAGSWGKGDRLYMQGPWKLGVPSQGYQLPLTPENGDTLVVDTVGLNDRTYVDNFGTPHTTQLHVAERFKLVDGGEALDVRIHVEDPGAFTMPWNAGQRYRRDQRKEEVPLHEMVCAENNEDHFNQGLVPIPRADKGILTATSFGHARSS
jgi:hypothetical protein